MFKRSKEPEKKGSEKKRIFARFVFERCSFRFCDYIMILDFVNDRSLIERIKSKQIPLSTLKKEFQLRGTRIGGGRITDYMSKLIPSLNQEDFILDIEDGDPYDVQFGFIFA